MSSLWLYRGDIEICLGLVQGLRRVLGATPVAGGGRGVLGAVVGGSGRANGGVNTNKTFLHLHTHGHRSIWTQPLLTGG